MGRDARSVLVMVRITPRERVAFAKGARDEHVPLGPWLIQPRRDELKKGK
ncbi:MAG: hypothetical protein V2A58_12035 [Planctomycetota bacterium]